MIRRTYPAQLERLPEMLENFRADIAAWIPEVKVQKRMELCAEEIFVNIISYAYGESTGDLEIVLDYADSQRRFSMQVTDAGKPYNPLEGEHEKVGTELEDTPIGGLGIFLYTTLMDGAEYQYVNGKNQLTLWKDL